MFAFAARALPIALLFLAACSSPSLPTVESASVATESGRSVPVATSGNTLLWRDIPYAQPPVGDLRWRAPQPLSTRDTLIPAQQDMVMCPQPASQTAGIDGDGYAGREDCLYLDVVAPTPRGESPLPVMFWIHGGGNTTGTKGTYDFSALAEREQVVVVTINYRLGPFGWFAHPALGQSGTDVEASSNFGSLDIISALGWVQRNIAAFGGDPGNVTVFGESAGGRNVFTLLASPLSEGLFHRAIVQSGHVRSLTPEQAHNANREDPFVDRGSWEVANALGFEGRAPTASQLRGVSTSSLLSAYYELPEEHIQPAIIADDIVVPAIGLKAALADPQYAKRVPVMVGSNRDEVGLWLGLNRYFVDGSYPLTRLLPPKLRIRDEALYDFWVGIRSRAWKARGVDMPLASLEAAGYSQLYAYRFDWDEQTDSWFFPFTTLFGAAHASEIAFVMGREFYGYVGHYMYPDSDSARDMTDTMMSAWGGFARGDGPGWPAWTAQVPNFMVLDAGAQQPRLAQGIETMDGLLNEVASSQSLKDDERCILVWESLTAVGQPDYDQYRKWNGGECAAVDAPAAKAAIRGALIAEYGSADLP